MYLVRCDVDSGNRRGRNFYHFIGLHSFATLPHFYRKNAKNRSQRQKPVSKRMGTGKKVSNTLKRKIMSFSQKYSQAQPSALLLALLLASRALSSLQPLLGT